MNLSMSSNMTVIVKTKLNDNENRILCNKISKQMKVNV